MSSTARILDAIPDNIPAELTERPQWVVWLPEERADGRIDKVPHNPRTGYPASHSNPRHWGTFAEAVAAYQCDTRWAGIGYVFHAEDPYAGVDLDGCRYPDTGELEPWAEDIVRRLATYTEASPSGTGVKAIVRGRLEGSGRKSKRVEVYDRERFFTLTGHRLPDAPATIEDRHELLTALVTELFPPRQTTTNGRTHEGYRAARVPTAALLERAGKAKNGSLFMRLWQGDTSEYEHDDSRADAALCRLLAFWTGPDREWIDALFRESGLYRDKWERADYRDRTIGLALEGLSDWYDWNPPTFVLNGEHEHAAPSRRGPRDNGTSPSEAAPRFPLTDTGNAERLVYRHGKRIRFNWGRGVWYVWEGKRWAEDETGTLERLAKDTIRAIPEEAAGLEGDAYTAVLKWAGRSESDGKRQAMIRLARSEPGIPVRPDELDADPWKLNVANGTLDLRTGTLRPHDPSDYITRLIPVDYAPHATCPTFDAFLERIFGGDQDVIAYVWRLIGYSLTGDTREQCIVVCWGTGANGKSTLLGTLHDLLADYAAEADADSFMERKHEGIREDIAALDGVRFVSAVETSDGKRLSEALVKKMTGGERLRARRLYENGYVFLPQFKVWLATNHKPEIRGGEHAIWRRIKLLPFNVTIPRDEWDTDLRAKLRAEAPGILTKAVRGCLEWQRTGLREPEAVTAATDAYRREMDVLGDWLEDRCILRPGAETAAKALYEDYVRWCQEQGSEPIKQKTFGRRLTDRGCGERKSGSTRYRTGIAFRPQGRGPEPSPDDPGTHGTYGTQDPESPLRKSMGGKFRENASHTSHTSQTNAGDADDWGDVE